jgi:hypothetical protein
MMIFLPTELCVSCMILIPYSNDVVEKNPRMKTCSKTGQDRHDRPSMMTRPARPTEEVPANDLSNPY